MTLDAVKLDRSAPIVSAITTLHTGRASCPMAIDL